MKKILFASTALVAFGAAAQAEVILSGNAEMGIFDRGVDDNPATPFIDEGTDAEFFTDIDVTFTLTGETDNGLAFGASVDLDEGGVGSDAVANNSEDGGIAIFLTGAFGTVTLGDTDGALDWALTEVAFDNGSLADDETEHAGYNGSYLDGREDNQILRYDYTIGDFGVALSYEQDDDFDRTIDPVTGQVVSGDRDGTFAIGFRYTADLGGAAINLGLGYQETETDAGGNFQEAIFLDRADVEAIGFSANTVIAGFTVGVQYTEFSADFANPALLDTDVDHVGVGVGYADGPIAVSANYGEFDFDDNTGIADREGYGLSAGYDLGGGAVIQLGYGHSDFNTPGVQDIDTYSFGLRFNF